MSPVEDPMTSKTALGVTSDGEAVVPVTFALTVPAAIWPR